MREDTIARIYADALMQAAEEKRQRKEVREEIEDLAGLLETDEGFRLFIEAPQVDRIEKKRVAEKLFKEKLSATTLHFLYVLLDKNRQYLLRRVARQYGLLDDEKEGITQATVTSAGPLPPELLKEIRQKLEQTLGTRLKIVLAEDPGLLAGIVVQYEDKVLDGSIRKRLDALRERTSALQIMEGVLYED
jgi:F-type H+-transporting ATPase subunit delta